MEGLEAELHLYAAGLRSLAELADAHAAQLPALQVLNLHANRLAHIDGDALAPHLAPQLRALNLSSNELDSMAGIGALAGLVTLDLSSNCLRRIEGLGALSRLQRLLLAHNCIEALSGLVPVHGGLLRELDLRDNRLSSLPELRFLDGLNGLNTLSLELPAGRAHGNEVCAQPGYRQLVVALLPGLRLLDGRHTKRHGGVGRSEEQGGREGEHGEEGPSQHCGLGSPADRGRAGGAPNALEPRSISSAARGNADTAAPSPPTAPPSAGVCGSAFSAHEEATAAALRARVPPAAFLPAPLGLSTPLERHLGRVAEPRGKGGDLRGDFRGGLRGDLRGAHFAAGLTVSPPPELSQLSQLSQPSQPSQAEKRGQRARRELQLGGEQLSSPPAEQYPYATPFIDAALSTPTSKHD
ncbi:hypothetical protein T492DRAFT_849428 [Pavlovales sp. CCMP2436]|nr:hypothetical protein T492DRAFT_849428 [Pavlovales sp. CCMP2436]